MQHMLLIREDGETRTRYFQLIDSLISQIVLDRRGGGQDLSQTIGMAVSQVVSKLADQERLEAALDEAKEAKSVAEKALKDKHDLQMELSRGAGKRKQLFV